MHEGKHEDITALELRLGQIGRQDVADQLNHEIVKESKDELKRLAANDSLLVSPFKGKTSSQKII